MLPSPDKLNDYEHGKFVLSNLAAKRAKQLREGAPPLVQVDSNHPLTIALAEIAAGRIKPLLNAAAEPIEPVADLALLIDENMPAELGMLLPAIDETEVALIGSVGEEDADGDDNEDGLSLSDLVEDEDEASVVESDEDTLSLTDIAEQESSEGEESDED